MGNRVFHLLVFALWLLSMGWLVTAKILPVLWVGQPPVADQAQTQQEPLIGWRLQWNRQTLGWAATYTTPGPGQTSSVVGRVVIERLPLDELTPAWLEMFIQQQLGEISMDARTHVEFDSFGQIARLRSTIDMGELRDLIRMEGYLTGPHAHLKVRAGTFEYQTDQPLPSGALLASELTPQPRLANLRLGQSWTAPVFSPLRLPHQPLSILTARVDQETFLQWDGRPHRTWLVVFRNDPGESFSALDSPHSKIWVTMAGDVLQHEVRILQSKMTFVRMTPDEAETYRQQLVPRASASNTST